MKEIDQVMHTVNDWDQPCVIATVVKNEGSSYRKPGAIMLIGKDGSAVGAVSGGCIEKEVIRRSQQVFSTGHPTIVKYDGRYTLGCNGTLYILIEPFAPVCQSELLSSYFAAFESRDAWSIVASYAGRDLGSVFIFDENTAYALRRRDNATQIIDQAVYQTTHCKNHPSIVSGKLVLHVNPSRQLYIIGNELDAFKLAILASELGYIVKLIAHPKSPDIKNPDRRFVVDILSPESLHEKLAADDETAVVLMTHSYSRDLAYLKALLKQKYIPYLGLVGPKQRTNHLLSDMVEQNTVIPEWLEKSLHAPVGLDLGGELPAEIAISIISEIQTVFSGHSGKLLSNKTSSIHSQNQKIVHREAM